LEADQEEGCARRICSACVQSEFIGDSAEVWEEAEPEKCICPCKGDQFEIGIAFSRRADGEVRWMTVGERCIRCGVLGSCVDWKIDYAPSQHLLTQV
jgi:hypothetical protein